jgi:hypothetical protein
MFDGNDPTLWAGSMDLGLVAGPSGEQAAAKGELNTGEAETFRANWDTLGHGCSLYVSTTSWCVSSRQTDRAQPAAGLRTGCTWKWIRKPMGELVSPATSRKKRECKVRDWGTKQGHDRAFLNRLAHSMPLGMALLGRSWDRPGQAIDCGPPGLGQLRYRHSTL